MEMLPGIGDYTEPEPIADDYDDWYLWNEDRTIDQWEGVE